VKAPALGAPALDYLNRLFTASQLTTFHHAVM
jgi:hypothetical protein